LQSDSFSGDRKLEAAAVSNPAHILKPATGIHVSRIQRALIQLDGLQIDKPELDAGHYGDSTASAVVQYKQKRNIINRTYEDAVDPIVGIMTMASLDKDLAARERLDPDFIFLNDAQRSTVKAALTRAREMLDVTLRRIRAITNSVVSPHNLAYFETKLDILNVFRINSFVLGDLPIPDDIFEALRRKLGRSTAQPTASTSPVDAFNIAVLLQNFAQLRASLDEKFRKEFYTMNTFNGESLGLFEAFVSSSGNFRDATMHFRPLYFDPSFSADHRAVTLAHERAHTIFHAQGHPGTGDNPFCVAPHLGDPNVQDGGQALSNPYCYEWLILALQPNYTPAPFLQGCVVTGGSSNSSGP
jgi:peptidoglycan hydrolase-like protein with peptidoglycan-binding domain